MTNFKALKYLAVPAELKEIESILKQDLSALKLQYLRGSAQKGLRLWNVLAPQLKGYPKNGELNGYPTFSIQGLKSQGLV